MILSKYLQIPSDPRLSRINQASYSENHTTAAGVPKKCTAESLLNKPTCRRRELQSAGPFRQQSVSEQECSPAGGESKREKSDRTEEWAVQYSLSSGLESSMISQARRSLGNFW